MKILKMEIHLYGVSLATIFKKSLCFVYLDTNLGELSTFFCHNEIKSGRSGVLLLPSPLRTERASFQALGSSNITLCRNEFYGDNINWCDLKVAF